MVKVMFLYNWEFFEQSSFEFLLPDEKNNSKKK
jgi:hypothetical protein